MPDDARPVVRIVPLSGAVFRALAEGDLAAANAAGPVPLSAYFAGPEWRGVWTMRGRQVEEDPGSEAWVTGVIWDERRRVAVGRAGYHGPPDPAGMVEIGYAVDPAYRRRGYARAALEALLRRAAEEPEVRTVRVSIAPGNLASYRLAAQYGFVEVGRQWDDEDGLEIVYERPAGDRATVSAMGDGWLDDTRASYDADASGYAEKVRGLLEGSPYLRLSLDSFAETVDRAGGGPVADVGCGPGYVTGYLHDAGVDAFGIDLSPEMVTIARRDHPDLRFEVGSMTGLDLADDSLAGIVAFWSVIHVPDHAVPGVFAEFRRVLRPGGSVLVGFHVDDGTHHTSEGYTGRPISVDSHCRRPGTVSGWLRDAGFTVGAELLIRPYDDIPGAVIFARDDG